MDRFQMNRQDEDMFWGEEDEFEDDVMFTKEYREKMYYDEN